MTGSILGPPRHHGCQSVSLWWPVSRSGFLFPPRISISTCLSLSLSVFLFLSLSPFQPPLSPSLESNTQPGETVWRSPKEGTGQGCTGVQAGLPWQPQAHLPHPGGRGLGTESKGNDSWFTLGHMSSWVLILVQLEQSAWGKGLGGRQDSSIWITEEKDTC